MTEIRMCKNDLCVKIVPPSLNSGVERKYCSWTCQNAQNQRNYRRRRSNENGDGVIRLSGAVPFMRRALPQSVKAAEKRFKKHLQHCILSEDGPCIGRLDPYDKKRLCLVRAVLREDWDMMRRAMSGLKWERELTTIDGMWVADALKQAQRVNIIDSAPLDADEDEDEAPTGAQPASDADPNESEMPTFPSLPDRAL